MRRTAIIRFDDKDDGQGGTHRVPQKECQRDWDLASEFLLAEGGLQAVEAAKQLVRLWAEIVSPDGFEAHCTGVVGIQQVWDVPIFHVADDKSFSRLLRRVSVVLQETCVFGARAMVVVSPEVEGEWKQFLEGAKGFKAYRWSIPVSLGE